MNTLGVINSILWFLEGIVLNNWIISYNQKKYRFEVKPAVQDKLWHIKFFYLFRRVGHVGTSKGKKEHLGIMNSILFGFIFYFITKNCWFDLCFCVSHILCSLTFLHICFLCSFIGTMFKKCICIELIFTIFSKNQPYSTSPLFVYISTFMFLSFMSFNQDTMWKFVCLRVNFF